MATDKVNGQQLATLFRYYRQDLNSKVVKRISLNRIRAKTLYVRYVKTWDRTADLINKYGIDPKQYIGFLVFEKHCTEYSDCSMFLSRQTLIEFRDYLYSNEKRKNIFRWFEKSANNIADICITNGYLSTKECLQHMIKNKTIGRNYVCGIISQYYLAAIPRFNVIIDRFDEFSKADLNDLKKNYDIYNTEINNAFLFFRNKRANPFEFTDNIIFNKKTGIKS